MLLLTSIASPAKADDKPWTGPSVWPALDTASRESVLAFGADYLAFLASAKTERETIGRVLAAARAAGFTPAPPRPALRGGEKLFFEAQGKAAVLVRAGRKPLTDGVRLIAAHVDSVRIDLKPNPIYEDVNVVLLQTQYYGAIHFAQWMSRPLALHGFALRADGTPVTLRLGSEPTDPVLVIPDVLVQLRSRVAAEAGDRLPAEKLDPIVSSLPAGEGPRRFARAFTELLQQRYGLGPQELRSAELSLVPATGPRSVGLDQALVGGYGQDDRASVFAATRALLALDAVPEHTAVLVLFDRQEVGSTGPAGARSDLLRRVLGGMLAGALGEAASEQKLRELFVRSRALSADATPAVDPHFKQLHERRNAAYLGGGPVVNGAGGHAEQRAWLTRALGAARVPHQFAEFSRSVAHRPHADTLLPYLTRLGLAGAQLAVPLMSMHAPFELASKADVYLMSRACEAFFTAPE